MFCFFTCFFVLIYRTHVNYYLKGYDLIELIPEGYELANSRYGFSLHSNTKPIEIIIKQIGSTNSDTLDTPTTKNVKPSISQNIQQDIEVEPSENTKLVTQTAFIVGYPDGTFRPSYKVSREEIASMIFELSEKSNVDTNILSTYKDINIDSWSSNSLSYLVQNKLMSGYGNITLKTNENMTRGELAQVLSNMNLDNIFSQNDNIVFNDTTGHWSEDAINKLCSTGIMKRESQGNSFIRNSLC